MCRILFFLLFAQLISLTGFSQLKDYNIGPKGDTLNGVDNQDRKQGKWVNHVDEVRGEPGFEEEGLYKDNHKVGTWRIFSLQGDLIGVESYRWGLKCGVCKYFGINGTLLREETWVALDPGKPYDTLVIEDIDHEGKYKTVIVKNSGAALKDGVWTYYDPMNGTAARTETWDLGMLKKSQVAQRTVPDSTQAIAKPKEVLDFEKKAGKHKIKYQDGSVH